MIKADRIGPKGKGGTHPGRPGDAAYVVASTAGQGRKENEDGGWSRSRALLGLTYDEWEGGAKDKLKGMLVR